ncbi:MAG: hypothetical protein JXB36_01335 [Gammaproteobacteria bacterium]|nr:hypothetical protein [Gammaproteobacteria bacterium]
MDSSDTEIFGLASVGGYLDALSAITSDMSLKERDDLIHLDKSLHGLWKLGQNVILCWCPENEGISLVVVPHYAVAEISHATARAGAGESRELWPSRQFLETLLCGRRQQTPRQMDEVVRLLGVQRLHLPLRAALASNPAHEDIIEKMIKRYSITYVPCRAVAQFDIVGFSLLSPFEQMTQLNSLAYSLNAAQSKLLDRKIGIDFARATTGDGFYVWNRDLGLDANVNLYHLMYLALADNAIARRRCVHDTVPKLRAAFHVGRSYEFHQSEGLNPTLYHYIVGDVTLELARMMECALPHQILVGDFRAELGESSEIGTLEFVSQATKTLSQLKGLTLSGDRVEWIESYLTGVRLQGGGFTVRRITVSDRHGISRHVYNAKANIYRRKGQPILLGIEDRLIEPRNMPYAHTEHMKPTSAAH